MRRFRQLALGLVLFSMAGHSWGDCIEGDCFNGQGKETYIFFGKVYEGDFKDGQEPAKESTHGLAVMSMRVTSKMAR